MAPTQLITLVVVAVVLVIGVVSFFASRIGVAAPLALTVVGSGWAPSRPFLIFRFRPISF